MKYLFFDLETTGLDPKRCAIHQLAGIIEIDGVEVERFNLFMKPLPGKEIQQQALDLKGLTIEKLNEYTTTSLVFNQFLSILGKHVDKFQKTDKFFPIGWNNNAFDNEFLRQLFEDMGDKYFGSWFWNGTIDVMCLAAYAYRYNRHNMENFKLSTVAAYAGLEVSQESLHDGLYDVELTRGIFKILTKKSENP